MDVVSTKKSWIHHRRIHQNRVAVIFDKIWTPEDFADQILKPKKITKSLLDKDTHLLAKFFDENYPFLAKCIWFIIITLCFAITLFQVSDRIDYYLSEPVTISLQVLRNSSMEFPAITLCNKAEFKRSIKESLSMKLAAKRNISVKEITEDDLIDEYGLVNLQRKASYVIPDYISECYISRTQKCSKALTWVPVDTTIGICYTGSSVQKQIQTSGAFQALYIMLNPDEEENGLDRGWKILMHHSKEHPDFLIQTHGQTLYPDTRADFILGLRQFIAVNRASKYCNNDPAYSVKTCEADCMYRFLARNYSCRLPHMVLPEYPICNSSAVYRRLQTQRDNFLVNNTLWNSSHCNCPNQCWEDRFTNKFDIRYLPSQSKTVLKIYYEELTYECVEEILSYKIVSLLSDIGGNLGLFLGICVISIFETTERLVLLITQKIKAACL